ncbi:Pkinase-domain-containing protein [Obba rivulosa]|uniref:Pkinase-domain-containing protein n=1 Tax=Obba rivulosa TaxID=1052685 RepID=A0A8E2DQ19_9APHY|nr:Pkinase-domain-containing protein [Obba rivulosa]
MVTNNAGVHDAHHPPQPSATSSGEHAGEKLNNRDKSSSPVPSPGSSNGRRGRSRTRNPRPRSIDDLKRKGYHSLMSSFGKAFHVEKRWKLIRELGSGAYGFVISAVDDISGEPVAIKMVTRPVEKLQLAKRALREITLLRHFSHENITGLIDVDCTPDLSEIYIFMEPMEADLHQIIKSGQILTNEHVQYFVYQILRGMKYIHSSSVVHRDLKPGNLLVNADCELKICDFGLARGYDSAPDENPTAMTEYVATRWYRAPEIMLAFRNYDTAIDVWSIGCIFAELVLGKPLFKGKDYVDQLNKILDVLGTPNGESVRRIASHKAYAYIESLPLKKTVPFSKLMPSADPQALDLLTKMLTFDPSVRLTVAEALEHPYLSSYHDVIDEPECPQKFDKWHEIEKLETLEQFRDAIYDEIQDYRKEVRSFGENRQGILRRPSVGQTEVEEPPQEEDEESHTESPPPPPSDVESPDQSPPPAETSSIEATLSESAEATAVQERSALPEADPVIRYARRASVMLPSRTSSYVSYSGSQMRSHRPLGSANESSSEGNTVAFPTSSDYVVPARSRTASMFGPGGEASRKLLRTLSTVSIYESGEGLAGGLADIAPIGKYIVERDETLPSELPHELESPPKAEKKGSEEERKEGHEKRFHIA